MIGGRNVEAKRVAILIDGLMLPLKGRLLQELQVRSLQLSPLVTKTNLRPAEIIKHLPPLPASFDQIVAAMKGERPLGNQPSVREVREAGLREALACSPTRANVVSFASLQSLVALRENRKDLLVG